jgi:hypothetical protein
MKIFIISLLTVFIHTKVYDNCHQLQNGDSFKLHFQDQRVVFEAHLTIMSGQNYGAQDLTFDGFSYHFWVQGPQ